MFKRYKVQVNKPQHTETQDRFTHGKRAFKATSVQ